MTRPEDAAREIIDAALHAAGWAVQDRGEMNLYASLGVAVREFPLEHGFGFADYLLYVDHEAVGVVEAKKEGTTLIGVEIQARKYAEGLPQHLPAKLRPLPFLYQSTGIETRFTNLLDPEPRSRRIFHFQRPETLARWLDVDVTDENAPERPTSLRGRLRNLPPLDTANLWPAQCRAVANLEASLAGDRPRALIQMATGSGKTFTAVTAVYRMIKHGGAGRVLFLVDRDNLGKQAEKEFGQYRTPDDGRRFTELYNVQRLGSNKLDPVANVVITTIQRLYSMLQGQPDLDPALEEGSAFDTLSSLVREPVPVAYNPALPIELFDVVFVDECHRSIYTLWRQVLEYFDAYLVGLTATPSRQTFGFFNQNLVMDYDHERAVADGVNVGYDIYKIRTRITVEGATVEAGPEELIGRRDRETRATRWEKLDDDLTYEASTLDRQVVALDQIRTVIRTFREKLFTEMFPERTWVPKTLIFAKDDSHADDIVQAVREEFGKGNEFCQKITYRTTGEKPETLLKSFQTSPYPRVVVTVDMIATGTDIKPLEIVMFLRAVKSLNFFEQMKGRGVRVIDRDTLRLVTPDADGKDHFVLVDCVGVCESKLTESLPLERNRGVGFDKLLNAIAGGSTKPDILSSLAGRIARIDRRIGAPDRAALAKLAGGLTLADIAGAIVESLDADRQVEQARAMTGLAAGIEPTPAAIAKAALKLAREAVAPLAKSAELRDRLGQVKKSLEQAIDAVTPDEVLEARFAPELRESVAGTLVRSFEAFLAKNKDEITALQILYSRPYAERLKPADVKALAAAIQAPPRSWTPEVLWRAYETLGKDKVRGVGIRRLLTDVVSLVRFALHHEDELVPYADRVNERFAGWVLAQENQGRTFTQEQRRWLEAIRDHFSANLEIAMNDLEYMPFNMLGGVGKANRVFGGELERIIGELNEALAA